MRDRIAERRQLIVDEATSTYVDLLKKKDAEIRRLKKKIKDLENPVVEEEDVDIID